MHNLGDLPGYLWLIIIAAFAAHIWMLHWLKGRRAHHRNSEHVNETDIVSRNGLHWHPKLTVYVKGVKQEVPQIGLSDMSSSGLHQIIMRLRHKHDGSNEQGIVHLKFQGLVRKSDITLGQLFKKWGKDIRSFGTNLKMTVNGRENTEYENYVMQDKDKIELYYDE